MGRAEGLRPSRRLRLVLAWLLTILVIGIYFALPSGDEPQAVAPSAGDSADVAAEPRRLDILEVVPSDASPGSAITVAYSGAPDAANVGAFAGKIQMEILARRKGSLVARLPSELLPGRTKIRVAVGAERSKPYDLRLKAANWRKPFRSLVGGFALLIFGITVLARGAREAAGLGSAHALARLAGQGPAALGLGAAIGALAQSTTAAAGLLSGLVASRLLAIGPAAIAFLGAELGAATAPLVTGLIDPREGLLVVAVGVLWLGFASDRRSSAIARLVLGAGLIAFGLQTLRPGFEPFLEDPTLLSFVARLRAENIWDIGLCAALGALLVAALQGPAPVCVLVLVLAQTTAQWDLRTALGVLSGAGFGAALGALVTTPAGRRGRKFALLNLILGAASTLLCIATVNLWSGLADLVVPGVPHEIEWGKRVLLPNLGLHLGVAFGISQLASAVILLPIAPLLARWLERRLPEIRSTGLREVGAAAGVVRAELQGVLSLQREALGPLRDLVLLGSRSAGRVAEHSLADSHAALEELLAGAVPVLPDTSEARILGGVAFGCLQLQRSLEGLHRQAERLVDSRVAASAGGSEVEPLTEDDTVTLGGMHVLLTEGVDTLIQALETRAPLDLEAAQSREIRMNGFEARARRALLGGGRDPVTARAHLGVLELLDAYESSGNQLYRLSVALAESVVEASAVRVL